MKLLRGRENITHPRVSFFYQISHSVISWAKTLIHVSLYAPKQFPAKKFKGDWLILILLSIKVI